MELHEIAFITVLLSDMSLFPAVNAIYGTFFGTSPPARACVAVDLPSSVRIRLEVIACKDNTLESSSKRQALHVQGLSYWAPANIGPYSQAVRVGGLNFYLSYNF
jgi:diphthine-ammonia ligase